MKDEADGNKKRQNERKRQRTEWTKKSRKSSDKAMKKRGRKKS